MFSQAQAVDQLNQWGAEDIPFLFFTDFLGEKVWAKAISKLDPKEVSFNFNGRKNLTQGRSGVEITFEPIRKEIFNLAFSQVLSEINYGNSFLTNLTFETPIKLRGDLSRVFHSASARYKLKFEDSFICFSPETFVSIVDHKIRSFPMKGTISAKLPNASAKILADLKETAEHITIVDLIRNDLSQVATNVRVDRFRYVDEIRTSHGNLLQVSSEIVGDLSSNWKEQIGTLIFALLPAGSISGAPKSKTIDIIRSVENHDRGFYTGICGLFEDGKFDSGVMIRFIEKRGEKYFYKGGGGITALSNFDLEYQEYISKIYVPVH